MRAIALICAGLLFCWSAAAQESLRIEGGFDCGVWAIARKEKQAEIVEHYLVGLIDGLALGMSIDLWRAGDVALDREQVYRWMDRYCARDIHLFMQQGALEFAYERAKGASLKKMK